MPAIYRGPTRGYTLTESDIQWLARSMWGEASSAEGRVSVAWSELQRFLLLDWIWLKEGWSFARFLRAYSQPINPKYRYQGPIEVQEHRRHITEDAIPQDVLALARSFASGDLPNPFPEPVYGFVSKGSWAGEGRPGPGITIGGNTHVNFQALKADERRGILFQTADADGGAVLATVGIGTSAGRMSLGGLAMVTVFTLIGWWFLEHWGSLHG